MPAAPARVVVIGAGIAGVAAAHRLLTSTGPGAIDVVVLEAGSDVGGKLRLGELAGAPVDLGAEALLARRPEALDLARAVGLGADLVTPRTTAAAIAYGGRLRRLPPRHVMGVPTDVRSMAATRLFSPWELLRARRDYRLRHSPADVPAGEDPLDVPVGPYVARRLGPAVVDRLVEPLLSGVYAGRADSLSLAAVLPQIAAAMRSRDDASLLRGARQARARNAGSRKPVFAGIRGGVGRLPRAVVAACGAEVRTSAVVRDVARTPHGWQVAYGPRGAERIEPADAVIVAVPAVPAGRMLAEVAPIAAASLARMSYASVAIVHLAFPRTALPRSLSGSGFLVPPSARRLVKGVTVSSSKWGWHGDVTPDLIFVRASIGRLGEEAALQHEDDDLIATVLKDLAALCGLIATPVDARVVRWGGALPQYDVGHLGRVSAISTALEAPHLSTLALAGAAYDGVGVAACVASGQGAADRVSAALTAGNGAAAQE